MFTVSKYVIGIHYAQNVFVWRFRVFPGTPSDLHVWTPQQGDSELLRPEYSRSATRTVPG